MQTSNLDCSNKSKRGSIRLVGFGTDSDDGVSRITRLDKETELHGGSVQTHSAMLERAQEILTEISRRGYQMDSLTYEEYEEVAALVAEMSTCCSEAGSH